MAQNMIRILFSALLVCQAAGYAQSGPQPPCGSEPALPYPGLDNPPVVRFWSEAEFGRTWRPPVCTGWSEPGFSMLVTTIARFRYAGGSEGLLRQIGAISKLTGMRYWSTTHAQWRTLIVDAHALTASRQGRSRQDFAPDEMRDGKALFLQQSDNLSGTAVYRMRVAEASADRLVFEVENISTMRFVFLTLFDPGEMQSVYFLDRESDSVWRYYAMTRSGRNASRLVAGHEASSINRAVAFYRSLVGIPTDQEPPAAR
jgi:hypothetical protein